MTAEHDERITRVQDAVAELEGDERVQAAVSAYRSTALHEQGMQRVRQVLDDDRAATERHRGQLRIAERLAAGYADRLLHVTGLGWHAWDGTRWVPDERGRASLAVMNTLKAALSEATHLDRDDRDHLIADVRRCESAAGVRGVLDLAAALPAFAAAIGDLDADPYLLNTLTGTIDLQTGVLRSPSPADRITKVTGAGYTPDEAGPSWETFLEQVLPDVEVRSFLQRLLGLALLGKVREHVLPIATGVGQNGKSTLINALVRALGDYAIEAEPTLLIERDRAHPTGQMDLRGVRLAVCQESDAGRRLAVATVKQLTGGDPIRARRMRQDFVQFDPSHLALLCTNHLPAVPGDDPALWRRLRVIPFDVVVQHPDAGLPDRLALERGAILAWTIEGYRHYAERGLDEPPAVLAATSRYHLSADALARFVEDRCLTGPHFHVTVAELTAAWKAWCDENGETAGNPKALAEGLERRGYTRTRGAKGVRRYHGLALQADDQEGPT
jgi:putative DNA primase/helicase